MIAPLLISFVLFLLLAAPVSIAMGLAAVIAIGWQGKVPLNTVVTQMVSGRNRRDTREIHCRCNVLAHCKDLHLHGIGNRGNRATCSAPLVG